jgi:serine/threonine protein kinase
MQVFLKVCHAVAHAHSRGILHLDIKPLNIWVGADGLTYLLDWGLSGAAQPSDASGGRAVGTPRYCAPEQVDRSVGEVGRVDHMERLDPVSQRRGLSPKSMNRGDRAACERGQS